LVDIGALIALPAQVDTVMRELRKLQEEVRELRQALPAMLVSMEEAAKHLGVNYSTIRRWVKNGSVPSLKIGSTVRVDLRALRPQTGAEIVSLAAAAIAATGGHGEKAA
jgi:excisionase family DNA binding protein